MTQLRSGTPAQAGMLAERVTGRSLEDLTRERMFEPLGMKDSWLVVPEAERARVVKRPEDAPLAGPSLIGPGLNTRENAITVAIDD